MGRAFIDGWRFRQMWAREGTGGWCLEAYMGVSGDWVEGKKCMHTGRRPSHVWMVAYPHGWRPILRQLAEKGGVLVSLSARFLGFRLTAARL